MTDIVVQAAPRLATNVFAIMRYQRVLSLMRPWCGDNIASLENQRKYLEARSMQKYISTIQ